MANRVLSPTILLLPMNTNTSGCRSDEISFSLDHTQVSGNRKSLSWWYLDRISKSRQRKTVLDGDSKSSEYPYRLCLHRGECYDLTAHGTEADLICSEKCCRGSPTYVLRVNGTKVLDSCKSDSLFGASIKFGDCDEISSSLFDWNPSTQSESSGPVEGLIGFLFLMFIILVCVLCTCSARNRRARTGSLGRGAGLQIQSPRGRASHQGVLATHRAQHQVSPSQSAPRINTASPAYGSEQRRKFVKDSLITKELKAIDVAPLADEEVGEPKSHSVQSFGPTRERSDFVQSSIRSLELRISSETDPGNEKSLKYSDGVCNICLEDYREGDTVCSSNNPDCAHGFHADCMMAWLLGHDECPNCRLKYLHGTEHV